jgi:hypothetical protein
MPPRHITNQTRLCAPVWGDRPVEDVIRAVGVTEHQYLNRLKGRP